MLSFFQINEFVKYTLIFKMTKNVKLKGTEVVLVRVASLPKQYHENIYSLKLHISQTSFSSTSVI